MSARDQGVAVWLQKAENDWLNVQNNLASARIPWDTVCFHAQQAVEKILKAILVRRALVPPRIHDVSVLMRQAFPGGASMEKWQDTCRELTQCAVLIRYTGEDLPPGRARQLVNEAGQLRQVLLERLKAVGSEPEGGET